MPSVKEITYEKLMTSLEEQQGTSVNGVVPDAITVQGVSHANKKRAKWSMIKDAVRHFKPGVSQTKTVEQYLIHYVSKIEKDLPPRKATKSTDSSSSARSSAPNNPPKPSEVLSLPVDDVKTFMAQQVRLMAAMHERMLQPPPTQQLALQNGGISNQIVQKLIEEPTDDIIDTVTEKLVEQPTEHIIDTVVEKLSSEPTEEIKDMVVEQFDEDELKDLAVQKIVDEMPFDVLKNAYKSAKRARRSR
mmetsp:Transcript_137114/g.238318  ORF Transcript_137114/g.238318 Transcript_137114/m.238318 type:complete len:246 (-) Transcript_137114:144-881(-)